MITAELTEEQAEHLIEGARQYGRCSLLTHTNNNQKIVVVVTNHRRAPVKKAKARPHAAPETETK